MLIKINAKRCIANYCRMNILTGTSRSKTKGINEGSSVEFLSKQKVGIFIYKEFDWIGGARVKSLAF